MPIWVGMYVINTAQRYGTQSLQLHGTLPRCAPFGTFALTDDGILINRRPDISGEAHCPGELVPACACNRRALSRSPSRSSLVRCTTRIQIIKRPTIFVKLGWSSKPIGIN